jgi:hypothetical protein
MSNHVEGIIANIGGDVEKFGNGMSIVTAKYPYSLTFGGETTEYRTMFNEKDVKLFTRDIDGNIKVVEGRSLPPQEYVFDATINMMGPTLVKATDIILKNVKK